MITYNHTHQGLKGGCYAHGDGRHDLLQVPHLSQQPKQPKRPHHPQLQMVITWSVFLTSVCSWVNRANRPVFRSISTSI